MSCRHKPMRRQATGISSSAVLDTVVDPKPRTAGVEIFPGRGSVGFRADAPSVRRRALMASVNFDLSSADLKIPVVVNPAFWVMSGLFVDRLWAKDRTGHRIIFVQNTALIPSRRPGRA
jgi:hypothetical protein